MWREKLQDMLTEYRFASADDPDFEPAKKAIFDYVAELEAKAALADKLELKHGLPGQSSVYIRLDYYDRLEAKAAERDEFAKWLEELVNAVFNHDAAEISHIELLRVAKKAQEKIK